MGILFRYNSQNMEKEGFKMKKIAVILAVVFAMCITTTAFASEPERILTNKVTFTIEGTTARCYVLVVSDSPDTKVDVKLWDGKTCLRTWSERKKGSITINENVSVKKGKTYTMTVDITVNGVAKPQIVRTKTC